MNSEYLRTFVTLAQLGSYTKTAQKMIVVTSTISKQIKQLEAELGKELIIRNKKSVTLTRAGEVFLEYAKQILTIEDTCIDELSRIVESDVSVRIGTVNSLFQGHVSDWLCSLMRTHPGIRCSVVTDHSQILLNRLYDGEIDMCLCYRSFHENNCACLPFVRDELILVTGGDNPSFGESGVTLDTVKTLPLIRETLLNVAAPTLYKELFSKADNVVLAVTTGNFIIPFLKAGSGYGFVVKSYVEQELASGRLRQVRIQGLDPIYLQSYLIYKRANPLVSKELLQHLHDFTASKPEA